MNTDFLSLINTLAQAPGGAPGGGGMQMIIMLVLMFVMMYFIAIRPQRKRQQELAKQIDAIKPGDAVITTGGVHAQVATLKERTVILKIAEGVKVEFERSAIALVVNPRTAQGAAAAAAAKGKESTKPAKELPAETATETEPTDKA